MYETKKVSWWNWLLCWFSHDMVETSRQPHHDRDIVRYTCTRCGKTESPI